MAASDATVDPTGPSDKVLLEVGVERAEVYLFGAHVLRWQSLGAERLWLSSLSAMDGTAAIRGGVPIAFPQFANQGELPLHGFARCRLWTVANVSRGLAEARVTMTLCDDEETRALWPHRFQLQYSVTLRPQSLHLELTALNTDERPWEFTTCFHGYWKVPDIERVRLEGLQGCAYIDKVDGFLEKREEPSALIIKEASEFSRGFVDRIYKSPQPTTRLLDHGGRVVYTFTQTSHPDTVIFNPWIDGKRGDKGPDYDDDGYKYAICVEPAIATAPLKLEPGTSWTGSQLIQLSAF